VTTRAYLPLTRLIDKTGVLYFCIFSSCYQELFIQHYWLTLLNKTFSFFFFKAQKQKQRASFGCALFLYCFFFIFRRFGKPNQQKNARQEKQNTLRVHKSELPPTIFYLFNRLQKSRFGKPNRQLPTAERRPLTADSRPPTKKSEFGKPNSLLNTENWTLNTVAKRPILWQHSYRHTEFQCRSHRALFWPGC